MVLSRHEYFVPRPPGTFGRRESTGVQHQETGLTRLDIPRLFRAWSGWNPGSTMSWSRTADAPPTKCHACFKANFEVLHSELSRGAFWKWPCMVFRCAGAPPNTGLAIGSRANQLFMKDVWMSSRYMPGVFSRYGLGTRCRRQCVLAAGREMLEKRHSLRLLVGPFDHVRSAPSKNMQLGPEHGVSSGFQPSWMPRHFASWRYGALHRERSVDEKTFEGARVYINYRGATQRLFQNDTGLPHKPLDGISRHSMCSSWGAL